MHQGATTHQLLQSLFWVLLVFSAQTISRAQSILPPVMTWKGKSETLIAQPGNPWITPAEKSGFVTTPDYKETMGWFKKLAAASPLLTMVSIGKSVDRKSVV